MISIYEHDKTEVGPPAGQKEASRSASSHQGENKATFSEEENANRQ